MISSAGDTFAPPNQRIQYKQSTPIPIPTPTPMLQPSDFNTDRKARGTPLFFQNFFTRSAWPQGSVTRRHVDLRHPDRIECWRREDPCPGEPMPSTEQTLLRDLAKRYAAVTAAPVMDRRRAAWRQHNSLKSDRPLIYVRAAAWHELPEAKCQLTDPFWRGYENFLRYRLYWHTLGDDSIFEPWLTLPAVTTCEGWGVEMHYNHSGEAGGAWKADYPIREPGDLAKLRMPWHGIDERQTAERHAQLQEVLGDILTINIDRSSAFRKGACEISNDLGLLRGIENLMLDMIDNPEWLKQLMKFMSDGILKVHDETERASDWGLCAHENQSMPYAEELPAPAANVNGVSRRQLWGFFASQEFTSVSPEMQEEFLLTYQMPIMEKFGLIAYGCCEDLTRKIDILRKIPNLRRIAVSPFADVARCAEQIGRDYVLSYRPSPADMVSYGFDPARIRAILRRDLAACCHCHTDITLKDVETVQGDSTRVRRWVEITRQVIEEIYG